MSGGWERSYPVEFLSLDIDTFLAATTYNGKEYNICSLIFGHLSQSSRPESQLRRKYGSRRTCRLYITFYTETHTMHLLNQRCLDLGIYWVIQKGCPQSGGCKLGIFRSSWLVFFKKRKSPKTNQNDLKIPILQPPNWGQPFWMTRYISKSQHHWFNKCIVCFSV